MRMTGIRVILEVSVSALYMASHDKCLSSWARPLSVAQWVNLDGTSISENGVQMNNVSMSPTPQCGLWGENGGAIAERKTSS